MAGIQALWIMSRLLMARVLRQATNRRPNPSDCPISASIPAWELNDTEVAVVVDLPDLIVRTEGLNGVLVFPARGEQKTRPEKVRLRAVPFQSQLLRDRRHADQ